MCGVLQRGRGRSADTQQEFRSTASLLRRIRLLPPFSPPGKLCWVLGGQFKHTHSQEPGQTLCPICDYCRGRIVPNRPKNDLIPGEAWGAMPATSLLQEKSLAYGRGERI